jgi:hypothetical protein|tara:strand:- start:2516 stop:2737 length:222 start_codon:yes stop_codon:yes gene_type:complete
VLAIVPRLPANLRLFPANKAFNEEQFRRGVADDVNEGWIARMIDGGVDTWISTVRDWYEYEHWCADALEVTCT